MRSGGGRERERDAGKVVCCYDGLTFDHTLLSHSTTWTFQLSYLPKAPPFRAALPSPSNPLFSRLTDSMRQFGQHGVLIRIFSTGTARRALAKVHAEE
jgi:hypothetical protein